MIEIVIQLVGGLLSLLTTVVRQDLVRCQR